MLDQSNLKMETTKIDIFIPVRLGNTRLPSKALKIFNNKPLLFYLLQRLKKTKKIRNIVVCTTENPSDDLLVDFLTKNNYDVFRGSEKDILKRFFDASKQFKSDFIINVDGDDIYTDPNYIEKLIDKFEETNADFVDMEGFPFGFRSIGFTKTALEKICTLKTTENTETGYRDFFVNNTSIIKQKLIYKNPFPKNLRFSLDYPQDFELAKIVFNKLGNDFHLEDLINLFNKEPELLKITDGLDELWNKHYTKNLASFSFKPHSE